MPKKILSLALLFFLANLTILQAQFVTPASAPDAPIWIKGGTIHVGDGETLLENKVIKIEKDKIAEILEFNALPEGVEVIDATGKHIYPGLILPDNTLGLNEIEAVRPTVDYAEVGTLNPNVRTLIAYNTDSELIPTTRSNGVLLTQATPRSGLVSGQSSVFALDGWNWEDAVYKADVGVHINIPSSMSASGWWGEPGDYKANKKRQEQLDKIDKMLADGAAYAKNQNPEAKNIKLEALKGLYDGSKILFVHADWEKDILQGIHIAQKNGVKNIVLVGGRDALEVSSFLKKEQIPIILARVFALPARIDDPYDQAFELPALLEAQGIEFCIAYAGSMDAMGARNLPFSAGMAVGYGWDKEKAIASLTSRTAKILGLENTGLIKTGYQANLIISEGDILDMQSNRITQAFIQGRPIDLNNKHKVLEEKFNKKLKKQE
ncbi:MAG: amidohydrolase family protein [Bernardetiaceae bacterium]|nr:amidohydrolase family protein [Bernardetiaceae bacterium]